MLSGHIVNVDITISCFCVSFYGYYCQLLHGALRSF